MLFDYIMSKGKTWLSTLQVNYTRAYFHGRSHFTYMHEQISLDTTFNVNCFLRAILIPLANTVAIKSLILVRRLMGHIALDYAYFTQPIFHT